MGKKRKTGDDIGSSKKRRIADSNGDENQVSFCSLFDFFPKFRIKALVSFE